MKKLNYLLAPLLVVPLLASCNKVRYTVTQEEYEKAITNEGVKFLQSKMDILSGEELFCTYNINLDSDEEAHILLVPSYGEPGKADYCEVYSKKIGDDQIQTLKKEWKEEEPKPETWESSTETIEQAWSPFELKIDWVNISLISAKAVADSFEMPSEEGKMPKQISAWTFENNKYLYSFSFVTPDDEEIKVTYSIAFENAKVKSFAVNEEIGEGESFGFSFEFTYQDIDIVIPEV